MKTVTRPSIRMALIFVGLLALAAAACSTPPEPFSITLDQSQPGAATIRVTGLSSDEAAALRAQDRDETAWRQILRVTSGAETSVAMAGRYLVTGPSLEFHPAFPLDPGRAYTVRFDPSQMPVPRAAGVVTAAVSAPAGPDAPPVSVSAIYPSADEWPANLLRFYVHFSGTMARQSGVGKVHVIDDSGKEVADALLPSDVDLWSPDQTRYTVLFEPGRVKRGIKPNLDEGRALVPGRTYTIAVDADWRDAQGRPLIAPYRRTVRIVAERESPLTMEAWAMSRPAPGTREPLVITVPAPLDRALFLRTVGIARAGQTLDGSIELSKQETEWRFTPAAPWERAPHELVVLSTLEDPSGNRIGRAFEVLPDDPAANREMPERLTRPIVFR